MDLRLPVVILSGAILAVLLIRALWIMRREKDAPRGAEPGTGYHEIDASCFTGGGGGGDQKTFLVPRDPQEYARRFVPRK